MSKLLIRIDDDETRSVWETALRARDEVAAWPAWKRNELPEDRCICSCSRCRRTK